MITLGVTLLLVSGALVIHEYEVSRSAILGQITEQARLIGRVSAPALRANDRTLPEQLIAGLKSQQDATRAAIFTGNGDLFTIILEHFKTVAATSSKCSVAFATSWRGRLVGQARHQPGSSVARPGRAAGWMSAVVGS